MHVYRKLLVALSFSVAVIAAVPASAQEAATEEDKIIAIVNGHEIRASEVAMATEDIVGQLPDLPPKMRFPFVVEYLIERHLLAQLATQQGIGDTAEYKRRLALYQAKALRDAYFAEKIRPQVTEEQVRAAYEAEAAKVAKVERVRARHVLLGSEKEAKEIVERLAKGEKFEDLAKKYSLDGSKEFGGDLGYFTEAEMVPEFSKAAFGLKAGEVSPPVKTDFGWHVIKLEDRKAGGAQPYEQVKQAIRNVLIRKKVSELMGSMRDSAKVEIIDEDLKRMKAEAETKRLEQQQKQGETGDSGETGVLEDQSGGKSDLQLPQ